MCQTCRRWAFVSGALGLVAVGGWTVAGVLRVRHRTESAYVEARFARYGIFDEATGLLSEEGLRMVGQRLVEISRREADSVGACLIRVVDGRVDSDGPGSDSVLAAAEAAEVVFRAGDAVGRVDDVTLMVVGKGPGFSPTTVGGRLEEQMAQSCPPGEVPPTLVIGVAVLHPWDDGSVEDLRRLAEQDLEVRLFVHGDL